MVHRQESRANEYLAKSYASRSWSIQRELANRRKRRDIVVTLPKPVVSFTFDDFPRSALYQGGAILKAHGAIGTYYASFGIMDQTGPTGEIFGERDLPEFVRQGHELGCHTFDHCHSWDTAPDTFEASILRNQKIASLLLPGPGMNSFSYPISSPRPESKIRVARHYATARGGGQTFNAGVSDLNFLKAFFIEQSRENFAAIKSVIEENACSNGWLIFATHDVCDSPTRSDAPPICSVE